MANLVDEEFCGSIDGRRHPLGSRQFNQKVEVSSFRYSVGREKDFVRIVVSRRKRGQWVPALSVKKFFGIDESPVLLLRRERPESPIRIATP